MELFDSMSEAAKGMKAQSTRMRVISENLANADTTATTKGGAPYQRKMVTFKDVMNGKTAQKEVEVGSIVNDQTPFTMKYDPSNPAADAKGYVKMPNVNPLIEMMDMREAQRSYEANLGVIDVAKSMMNDTITQITR
ncbi:MAG: flagellar basal body rod protein FlgC [Alphaproteobacteria bacterium]|nr:flagellar basal body rod protein FlgC [Alphaproteobacteria bacterium]MDE2336530.1 flagellar basal body rod protein FlgC [Alphaproteobacteria bacterium]